MTMIDTTSPQVEHPIVNGSLENGGVTKKLSVCMYTAESKRGHARYTRDLLTALSLAGTPKGYHFELVTSRDLDPSFQSTSYTINAILPPLLNRSCYRTKMSWGISRVLHYYNREKTFLKWLETRTDIDIIHFQEYTPWLAPWHYDYLRRRGLGVVKTVHNIANFGHSSRVYMRQMRRCWRIAWGSCSALIVHTEGLREGLAEFLGAGHPPIHVTPHAVWQERTFEPVPPVLSPPGEPARLLFFGALRRDKGIDILLQAMPMLPNTRLTIAGETESPQHREAIEAYNILHSNSPIEFLPRFIAEEEIAGLFDRSQVVVLPYTEFAAQSGVLHQAVAHGRPVVATSVGALGESVRRWGIGEVVEPGNPEALAEGVKRLLLPEIYHQAASATAQVRDQMTWRRMAEATLDVYHSLKE